MLRVEPLTVEIAQALNVQPVQAAYLGNALRDPDYIRALLDGGPAIAGIVDDQVMCIGGADHRWPGRAVIWAGLSADARPHMRSITAATMAFLESLSIRRLETTVRTDFAQGHRWVAWLGFEFEGRLRAYGPDGADHDMYARIS